MVTHPERSLSLHVTRRNIIAVERITIARLQRHYVTFMGDKTPWKRAGELPIQLITRRITIVLRIVV
jgi:hypothetical protein